MESKDYLSYLVQEIHTTVVATVDDAGLPVTATMDMMDADKPVVIQQQNCLHCGNCFEICPARAIGKRG
ncbi:MAG: 4Fe-4S binding protein [Ruminococcus sp.]